MINTQQTQNLADIATVSMSIGLPSLVVIEDKKDLAEKTNLVEDTLLKSGFVKANDYSGIIDLLSEKTKMILYIESGEKLDGLVLEIIAEFTVGIVSLADRKHQTGLKTVKFNPFKTALVIVMTRSQVEASYQRLYEYFGAVTSSE
ncbi:MAG: hypothetical protein US31_C0002G0030 [Berkelbacteria bacterium GW2011_GWA1_36_9]|uniref:Uncharacterized protein n=1 Tax=Berkelbacteria bacterium GW2011_GWA1_36_9 TaxID=1618331 RepID=A0A0G0FY05_9BACT|nr:MAG: hypothetical protein US31_C0002G0030 [Berkelbacteria bacterium GW2011_GWA1_36_9]